jgi:hypothetical protein
MRANGASWAVAIVSAGAVLAGTASVAAADPAPVPVTRHSVAGKGHPGRARHARRPGHHRAWPRTVVRCQNDDTEQTDDIDGDGIEPRHVVTPGAADGACSRDALNIADILAGDRPAVRRR